MSEIYRYFFPGKTTIHKWYTLFKKDRTSIEDDPRSERPVEGPLKKLLLEDDRSNKKPLAEIAEIISSLEYHLQTKFVLL